jgi:hypothetical protein
MFAVDTVGRVLKPWVYGEGLFICFEGMYGVAIALAGIAEPGPPLRAAGRELKSGRKGYIGMAKTPEAQVISRRCNSRLFRRVRPRARRRRNSESCESSVVAAEEIGGLAERLRKARIAPQGIALERVVLRVGIAAESDIRDQESTT